MSNHKLQHYVPWRQTRVSKVVSILGADSLRGKTLLELGCGYGDIGELFRDTYGTITTFAEGRKELVIDSKRDIIVLDQNNDWSLGQTYDIILHWGVLYHLENWQNDLRCVSEHMHQDTVMFLESEVTDSLDSMEIKVDELSHVDDQSIHGRGSRPSPLAIEQELAKLKLKFVRYDTTDLDTDEHKYSWKPENNNLYKNGLRRFWKVEKC